MLLCALLLTSFCPVLRACNNSLPGWNNKMAHGNTQIENPEWGVGRTCQNEMGSRLDMGVRLLGWAALCSAPCRWVGRPTASWPAARE